MTIEWTCAVCDLGIEDGSLETELGIAFLPNEQHQFFRAHFICLKSALHPTAADELLLGPMGTP